MKHLMIFLINIYQKIPGNFHNACKFSPTCSEYAKQAYKKYGFFKGSYLSIKRILKCNPLKKPGFDPVPDDYFGRKYEK